MRSSAAAVTTGGAGVTSSLGKAVPTIQLQPGDLLFYSHSSSRESIYHVTMYIGNGQIVQASTYGQPVQVINLAYMPGFNSARRLA